MKIHSKDDVSVVKVIDLVEEAMGKLDSLGIHLSGTPRPTIKGMNTVLDEIFELLYTTLGVLDKIKNGDG